MSLPNKFWTYEDLAARDQARTYGELSIIALRILKRMHDHEMGLHEAIRMPIAQVCGPISTGGLGSVEKNLARFETYIKELERQNRVLVFSQMPFENRFSEIWKALNYGPQDSIMLLEQFYRPLFESGMIKELHFLPDWRTSRGSCWEYDLGIALGIKVYYFER